MQQLEQFSARQQYVRAQKRLMGPGNRPKNRRSAVGGRLALICNRCVEGVPEDADRILRELSHGSETETAGRSDHQPSWVTMTTTSVQYLRTIVGNLELSDSTARRCRDYMLGLDRLEGSFQEWT